MSAALWAASFLRGIIMKSMKYITAVLLSLVLTFSFVACGEDPQRPSLPSLSQPENTASDTSHTSDTETPSVQEQIPPSGTMLFQNGGEGLYNYCPAVLQEEDGTRYLYYCTNKEAYNITDYIACRKGTPDGQGGYAWGEETVVLSPTAGTWDARHVCDPSVVAGEFSYEGEEYSYLLAYLGCTSEDNQENKIGLAAAKSPLGPYVKIGEAPFVDFRKDPAVTVFQWGVGQPSLVNLNKGSRVALFYTQGDKEGTRVMAAVYDLADLAAPNLQTEAVKVSEKGLNNLENNPDFLNNADVALSKAGTRLFVASDTRPNPVDTPDYIAGAFRVNETGFRGIAQLSSASWHETSTVGQEKTSFPRNHNVGLVRDRYGKLPTETYLTVYYTVAKTGDQSLWSYRLYEWNVPLS